MFFLCNPLVDRYYVLCTVFKLKLLILVQIYRTHIALVVLGSG